MKPSKKFLANCARKVREMQEEEKDLALARLEMGIYTNPTLLAAVDCVHEIEDWGDSSVFSWEVPLELLEKDFIDKGDYILVENFDTVAIVRAVSKPYLRRKPSELDENPYCKVVRIEDWK